MSRRLEDRVEEARRAALRVLEHNLAGRGGLPRTAGWGYPEPYTRDLMVSALGMLVAGEERLLSAQRRVLEALARSQSPRGHVPGLADDPADRGSSDTTPWFLIGLALYREIASEPRFLEEAAERALAWMGYQSPDDAIIVAQQPTSDWRDEQWVLGYGLYVNGLVHTYLRLYGRDDEADLLRSTMARLDTRPEPRGGRRSHEGLAIPGAPYYAMWSYKVLRNERFDLLGNSLAVLSGVASPSRARRLVRWTEEGARRLRSAGDLAVELPPCLFPYVRPGDHDWQPRYEQHNRPGEYHNGGVWPFVCGFYVAALVAAGRTGLARRALRALTELVRPARAHPLDFGFNEWIGALDGAPRGQDWQTWSAAMYLYAATCVERGTTPFFDGVRRRVGAWGAAAVAGPGLTAAAGARLGPRPAR